MRLLAAAATCAIFAFGMPRLDEEACESDAGSTHEVSSDVLSHKRVSTPMPLADHALLQTKHVSTKMQFAEHMDDNGDVSKEESVAGDAVQQKDGAEVLVEGFGDGTSRSNKLVDGQATGMGAPAPAPMCDDSPPNDKATCAQQKQWGKCEKDWMHGYCCLTCWQCDSAEHGCPAPGPAPLRPADPEATADAIALMEFLQEISESDQFMFGQHAANYNGQDGSAKEGALHRSDCEESVGKFPGFVAITGDKVVVEGAEWGLNFVRDATDKGAIVEVGWHPANPVTGGNFYDTSEGDVSAVTEGGSHWGKMTEWLDTFAGFFKQAEVPMIFRYYHEMSGPWFWWGSKTSQPRDMRKAFRDGVEYLRNKKHVHNLLIAWAPAKPASKYPNSFTELYPGDDFVDIVCFDNYGENDFSHELLQNCRAVVQFAEEHGKVPAICEVGPSGGTQNLASQFARHWWERKFLLPIKNDEICSRIAWAMTWANFKPDKYWIPLEGQPAHKGFQDMANDGTALFAGEFDLPFENPFDQ